MLTISKKKQQTVITRLSKKVSAIPEKERKMQLEMAVDGPETLLMVQNLISREQIAKSNDFLVFYHSYSHACFLYELHAVIAGLIGLWTPKTRADVPPPIPRLRSAPFKDIPTIEALKGKLGSSYFGQSIGDHSSAFRSAGISASCSLFKFFEAAPLEHLKYGYSIMDFPSFRGALKTLLNDCNITGEDEQDAVVQKLVQIAMKYKIPTWSMYNQHLATTQGLGWMMQICIHKDIVAQHAYACVSYGRPSDDDLFSEVNYLHKQARLYLPPSLVLDPTRCQIFTHSCNTANRAEMQDDLKTMLVEAGFDANFAKERFG